MNLQKRCGMLRSVQLTDRDAHCSKARKLDRAQPVSTAEDPVLPHFLRWEAAFQAFSGGFGGRGSAARRAGNKVGCFTGKRLEEKHVTNANPEQCVQLIKDFFTDPSRYPINTSGVLCNLRLHVLLTSG